MEPAAPGVDAETLRAALVEMLRARGRLQSPAIAAAFAQVPRHLFVPHVALEEAYRDTFLATKRQPDGEVISSSSQPEIMAIMLEQLDLRPGQRVLEIGTGTGYNAALLAHVVGEGGRVTTLDLDDGRRAVGPHSPRLPPDCRPLPRAGGRPPVHGHEDGRAQDGAHLPALRDRGRGDAEGGCREAPNAPRRPGVCGPRDPAHKGHPNEARQFEYRPSQPSAARTTGAGCAR
jgi:hypothetical protein